jgi:hypothetical protein
VNHVWVCRILSSRVWPRVTEQKIIWRFGAILSLNFSSGNADSCFRPFLLNFLSPSLHLYTDLTIVNPWDYGRGMLLPLQMLRGKPMPPSSRKNGNTCKGPYCFTSQNVTITLANPASQTRLWLLYARPACFRTCSLRPLYAVSTCLGTGSLGVTDVLYMPTSIYVYMFIILLEEAVDAYLVVRRRRSHIF